MDLFAGVANVNFQATAYSISFNLVKKEAMVVYIQMICRNFLLCLYLDFDLKKKKGKMYILHCEVIEVLLTFVWIFLTNRLKQ